MLVFAKGFETEFITKDIKTNRGKSRNCNLQLFCAQNCGILKENFRESKTWFAIQISMQLQTHIIMKNRLFFQEPENFRQNNKAKKSSFVFTEKM